MEEEVKDNMEPWKKMIEDKETEQKKRKVWDLGKLQVTTSEQ